MKFFGELRMFFEPSFSYVCDHKSYALIAIKYFPFVAVCIFVFGLIFTKRTALFYWFGGHVILQMYNVWVKTRAPFARRT